jgi:hypothetical protein
LPGRKEINFHAILMACSIIYRSWLTIAPLIHPLGLPLGVGAKEKEEAKKRKKKKREKRGFFMEGQK